MRSEHARNALRDVCAGRDGSWPLMRALSRWCMAHRLLVAVIWVVVAAGTTVVAQKVGPSYATNFTLPGTESQRAWDLLTREFRAQSGDVDTIVFHVSHGTIDSPAVHGAITPLLARVSNSPRRGRDQSLHRAGAVQVFAEPEDRVRDDQLRTSPPTCWRTNTGKPLLAQSSGRRAGPQGRGRRPGDREGRGIQPGPPRRSASIAALMILL